MTKYARSYLIFLPGLCGILGACPDHTPPMPPHQVEASELPAIKITSKSKLLLTYLARDTESFQTVGAIDDVPEDARGWVRVVNLATRPAQRRDHELVYVADLRQAKPDKTYAYVVMSRAAFELAAQNRAHTGAATPSASATTAADPGAVILYATSWCPACRAARSWLRDHNIPFLEKDIEKDPTAAAELMTKATKSGISPSGVPVLDVRGTLIEGFDPDRVKALLGGNP